MDAEEACYMYVFDRSFLEESQERHDIAQVGVPDDISDEVAAQSLIGTLTAVGLVQEAAVPKVRPLLLFAVASYILGASTMDSSLVLIAVK